MIGVIAKPGQQAAVEELFELFKTPWEPFHADRAYDVVVATVDEVSDVRARLLLVYGADRKTIDGSCRIECALRTQGATISSGSSVLPVYGALVTFADASNGTICVRSGAHTCGLQIDTPNGTLLRLGYDLFEEVAFLLSTGQQVEHASVPTLDIHIAMLRKWILAAGVPLVEIPPAPSGHAFAVCLTHDIDFIGIRQHLLDHSMWGFLYRSTVGALRDLWRRRIAIRRCVDMWRAAASLPFVYLGWARDFWEPFGWYLKTEEGLPATYYLIPFKRRAGEHVTTPGALRRATAYDVDDVRESVAALRSAGCEVGVHGIDAWHSVERGREERARIDAVTGEAETGIRMHWLLQDRDTPLILERAGYSYDSTCGYNDTVGYRSGTTQVFRPAGAQTLLELPLHIQDGALFYPKRLDLTEAAAEKRCKAMIEHAQQTGGALTVLWHDRSHGPERFWGDFYLRLVQALTTSDAWFGTAAQVVGWFRCRRGVTFQRLRANARGISLSHQGEAICPPLCVRFHQPSADGTSPATTIDVPWNGKTKIELDPSLENVSAIAAEFPVTA